MSWLSQAWRRFREQRQPRGLAPERLNPWQEAFCEWNAERLGIRLTASRERFLRSCAALPGGHGGRAFKQHAHRHLELCLPFWGNNPGEIHEAYAAHEALQFLRLLSYPAPDLADWPELRPLEALPEVVIVDFGCGLAHLSITLARHLRGQGRKVSLLLADLPLLQLEFLRWLCDRWQLPATIAPCRPESPIPPLPGCHLCVATEVLEHVHEPLTYLRAFATALKPGGFLLTNIADHSAEFLHVSCDLAPLRAFLARERWACLRECRLYRKP